ncbi:MAG TPA: hypothetical protein VFM56_14005, partial [Solimonas sp.]|nr:hypothetical protein [Solimonas sp.]
SFGAWTVMPTADGSALIAMTSNDSLQGLGLYCFINTQRCVWFITLKLGCDKSNQYQVFANSDLSGPAVLTLICVRAMGLAAFPGYYQYGFSDSDAINNLLRSSRHVAFAIALEDARFLSARFNLDGAHEAIANAQTQTY